MYTYKNTCFDVIPKEVVIRFNAEVAQISVVYELTHLSINHQSINTLMKY